MPSPQDPRASVDELFPPTETTEQVRTLRAELDEVGAVVATEPPVDFGIDDVEIELEIEQAAQVLHEVDHTLQDLASARPPRPPLDARPWLRLATALAAGLLLGFVTRGAA